MDQEGRPEATQASEVPDEMSLDDFVVYARTLQSASCESCGKHEPAPGGNLCESCSTPSLTDRLGVVGKIWRSIVYRLGIA